MFVRPFLAMTAALVLPVEAQYLGLDFDHHYTASNLGSVEGVPVSYGGLTFLDHNTLLLGGAAVNPTAAIYSVGVTRDPVTQRITGFAGSATFYADAPYLDGGLAFGPGGVLFYATYEGGVVGQIKPGSTLPDKTTLTSSIGLGGNGGGLQFVPDGFAGAGQLKLYRYSTGIWRTVPFTPDEYGTYELGTATGSLSLPSGGEGIVYISGQNVGFGTDSVLVSNWNLGAILAYEIDSNGDPILSTERAFLTGLSGAMGATIDPVTGDFLFNTYGNDNRVVLVSGFISVPEPGTAALALTTLVAWGFRRRR